MPPVVQTEIVKETVRVVVPVPKELTEPCLVRVLPLDNKLTYGDVVTYSVEVLGTLEECNQKLESIRKLAAELGKDAR